MTLTRNVGVNYENDDEGDEVTEKACELHNLDKEA
jgi:hypothetical protein